MVRDADGGGGSGQASVLAMSDEAVRMVRRRYLALAEECTGIADAIPEGYSLVTEACGPFFTEIDTGITPFTASWETTFMLTADEAHLIARSVHEVAAQVSDLDRTLTGGMLWATTS